MGSNRLPFYLNEPLLSADILGVAPYRVYLVSLQLNLYILSVALVLFARGERRVLPAILLYGVRTFLSPPLAGSDKRPACGKGTILLIIFVAKAFLDKVIPIPFFTFEIMEAFVVSALKYRPQQFSDVVGQQAITQTLENAIAKDQLPQALLFCGPRGVGKTTCARILAKKINNQGDQDTDQDFAFNIFELDAASNNSVEDIRNLNEQVRIPPQTGSHKVYIIDEVHMLSTAAFNAFLKTLEEPPKHVIFILATTEKHKIIPTILSRCQIFEFKRITPIDVQQYLAVIATEQGVTFEEEALHLIGQKADGAMRDALSIYDRMCSFCNNNLTVAAVAENLNILDHSAYLSLAEKLIAHEIPEALIQYDGIVQKGFDGEQFISGLASHLRNLYLCKDPKTIPLLEAGERLQARYAEQTKAVSLAWLADAMDLANNCELSYKNSQNKRLHVELCLMQIASLHFNGEKKKEA